MTRYKVICKATPRDSRFAIAGHRKGDVLRAEKVEACGTWYMRLWPWAGGYCDTVPAHVFEACYSLVDFEG